MRSPLDTRRSVCAALIALAAIGLEPAAGAPSGAPRLVSAKAVDADRDGSIDAFDLTFRAAVRGRPDRRAPFGFSVSGYRVSGVAAPKGRRVRVSVAESAACDLGATPRIAYRGSSRALTDTRRRPLRTSRTTVRKPARGAPRIVCAATSDADADGHLDAVVLTYSKPVRSRAQTAGRLTFAVDRYGVRSVDRARGRNITLHLAEREGFDTGALPAVIYRRPTSRRQRAYAVTGTGGAAASTTFNATRDRAAARHVGTSTVDSDSDGRVDGVRAELSEPVRAGAGAVAVEGAGVTGLSAGEGRAVVARLREPGLGGASGPAVSLGAGGSLRDSAGNVGPAVSVRAADGAAPVVTDARTRDRGGASGRLDSVSLTFSEPISHAPDSDGAYPLGVSGYAVAAVSEARGSTLEVSLREGVVPDGGARPAVSYTRGVAGAVRDGAGQEAATRAFGAVGDGVAPVLVGAKSLDRDLDGRVDAVEYQYSEPVRHDSQPCPGCSFTVDGAVVRLAAAAAGSTVTVEVAESESPATLVARYAPVGAGVRDPEGNLAPAGVAPIQDASPPVLLSAETGDVAGTRGKIDRIELGFSEPVSGADDAPPFSLAAAGHDVERVAQVSPTRLSLHLRETAAFDTGAAPAVSYKGTGGVRVLDAAGTEQAVRGYPGLTRDAVAPAFLGAVTADRDALAGDVPGKLDAVDLRFSEALQGGGTGGPFGVAGRTIRSTALEGAAVSLRLAEGASPDTDATLGFSYSAPATGDPAGLRDLPEGPGDGADEVASLTGTAADGAGPAVYSARTGDGAGDAGNGKLDRVLVQMSEPVGLGAGDSPALAFSSPDLTASSVTPSPDGRELLAGFVEGSTVDGDLTPTVRVSDPARVTDTAGNRARPEAFGGTTDGVRPALLGAGAGEQAAGDCQAASVDGSVDCVRVEWSEPVQPVSDTSAFAVSPFTLVGPLGSAAAAPYTDLEVGGGADRSSGGLLSYDEAAATPVLDLAGNPAFGRSGTPIDPACSDRGREPNDSQRPDNFDITDRASELGTLCAAEEDWFTVRPSPAGELDVAADPALSLVARVELWDADGVVATATGASAGERVSITETGLDPARGYWIRVYGGSPSEEDDYCLDPTRVQGEAGCSDGDGSPS